MLRQQIANALRRLASKISPIVADKYTVTVVVDPMPIVDEYVEKHRQELLESAKELLRRQCTLENRACRFE